MIPAARDRVRIRSRAEVYFVLGIDAEGGFASVVNLESPTRVEDVPFTRILPLRIEPRLDELRSMWTD